jgi:hypothetical protein
LATQIEDFSSNGSIFVVVKVSDAFPLAFTLVFEIMGNAAS